MPLLGWPLLVLLAALALLAVAVVVLLWERVPGPAAVRFAARMGLIGVCQLTAVLLVAAALNNYGYFYGSWSELLGTGAAPGAAVGAAAGASEGSGRTGAPSAGVVPKPGTARLGIASQPGTGAAGAAKQWASTGRLTTVTITGATSRLTNDAYVWFPPQYFQPAYQHVTFPAVVALTGYPGNDTQLVRRLHYPDLLRAEISSGRARPMILVMMRSTVAPPRDTECTDVPGGPQALTYLARDVPQALRSSIRVRPFGWGAIGESTGGLCAAKMAMFHPDIFSAGVSLSGYYHLLEDGTTGDLWGHSRTVRELNDPRWRLVHLPPPPVSLLLTISRTEHGNSSVADTEAFAKLARPPMSVRTIVTADGGHNFATWGQQIPSALDWLSKKLAVSR